MTPSRHLHVVFCPCSAPQFSQLEESVVVTLMESCLSVHLLVVCSQDSEAQLLSRVGSSYYHIGCDVSMLVLQYYPYCLRGTVPDV